MTWQASAPSNIALIKYMGKIGTGNVSSNASLSYTLNHLKTFVEIQTHNSVQDIWEPLALAGQPTPPISQKGQERFLKHFSLLKEKLNLKGSFTVRSNNNFPSDCGLASSASSFAALTLTAYQVAKEQNPQIDLTLTALADLSRQGSGSSCRSLFSPWSIWDVRGARDVDLPYKDLIHQVVVISDQIKAVSSSEAHKKISTSLLASERTGRAERRLQDLLLAIKNEDWKKSYELIWADFWDMHALFETSAPPFGYMSAGSLKVLRIAQQTWESENDGPWITMDAGPNVHLLYRRDQRDLAQRLQTEISSHFRVLTNL